MKLFKLAKNYPRCMKFTLHLINDRILTEEVSAIWSLVGNTRELICGLAESGERILKSIRYWRR